MAGHGLQYNFSVDGSSPQQPLYNVTHQSVIFKTFSRRCHNFFCKMLLWQ